MISIQAVKSFYYRPTRYVWRTPVWFTLWWERYDARPIHEEITLRLRALRLAAPSGR